MTVVVPPQPRVVAEEAAHAAHRSVGVHLSGQVYVAGVNACTGRQKTKDERALPQDCWDTSFYRTPINMAGTEALRQRYVDKALSKRALLPSYNIVHHPTVI